MSTWTRLRELLAAVMGPVLVLLRLRPRQREPTPLLVAALVRMLEQARAPRQVLELLQLQAHFPLGPVHLRAVQRAAALRLHQFGNASPRNSGSSAKTAPSTKRRRRPK